ncbi:hypothetical protein ACQQ2N_20255 [Dokdonella sp. MW10]|uniref:hypothetical protein n=1 Tax=Dokdonella sp. MW10 TaxID=2992926 RepID=UPI003F7F30B0
MRRWWLVVLALLCAGIATSWAQTPSSLEAWRGWVLKGEEFRACPLIAGRAGQGRDDYACTWPGTLSIVADANGAALEQRWRVDIDAWVALPGDAEHWPQQVTVDGQPAPVVDRNGPNVWLTAGTHVLRARIPWRERPQQLAVPSPTAIVALTIDGRAVTPVQREGDRVTLGRAADATVEADSLDVRVFRKFTDTLPGELETQFRLYVSGQVREVALAPVLPEGFAPLALDSDGWPARLDEQGRLHVQVQPGYAELTLRARATAPIDKIVARALADAQRQEIWSYEAVPSLRTTHASGAVQVDPSQADVPDEWHGLPAFALGEGDAITIDVRSRGQLENEANRLILAREAWLDFSGDGWFARDRVMGHMNSGWRLDVAPPFALQRAEGDGDALLVTRGEGEGTSGVEWRIPQVNLAAGVRIAHGTGTLPIGGWQQTFDQVTTTVNLPYGYRLVAAPGSDRANGSWLSRWTLLDVFLVAILVMLAARLLGPIGGVVAAAYLLLGFQEGGSPLWSLLAVIVLALVVRALPVGRLSRFTGGLRIAALVVFVIVAVPFMATQLRTALYPQLADDTGAVAYPAGFYEDNVDRYTDAAPNLEPPPPPPPAPKPSVAAEAPVQGLWKHKGSRAEAGSSDALESVVVTGSRLRSVDIMKKYSENTVVQTGGGEPGWRLGTRHTLTWSGPVPASQTVNLLVAPPWVVRPLRLILVALLGWLAWRLLRGVSWRPRRASVPALAGMTLVSLLPFSMVAPAQAQGWPSQELLQQWRERLVEVPKCASACASMPLAQVTARADEIRVVLEVHALERVAVPLPIDEKGLVLRSLRVDGAADDSLARVGGKPWIALGRGVHRVELVFAAARDKVDLAFTLAPRRVEVAEGGDWQAGGLVDDRLMTETLTLLRTRDAAGGPAAEEVQQFPAYVRVTRVLSLDLEWSTRTDVERLAPESGGFTVDVPVLTGERVSTPGLRVRNGRVTAALADGADETGWDATLDNTDTITLVAPPLGERAEVWRVAASPTWHVTFAGVPESAPEGGAATGGHREFVFHPLPGETLTITVTRPAAVDGATRAIDGVQVSSEIGERATTQTLAFTVRASQGGEHAVRLPKGLEVLAVTRDGATLGVRPRDGVLSLPVSPGTQRYEVRLRDATPIGMRSATPAFALGMPSANIDLRVTVPGDRWLLAAFGPPVGPAVLFWGELLAMVVLAWLLSRWRPGPLRFHQWLLLGIGFSTFSWLALGVVVAWLFAFDWRARREVVPGWRFNLAQVALAGLTLIAFSCLFASVHNGLLGSPDMVVRGAQSWGSILNWFADHADDVLPVASIVSLPLWAYNLAMLAWALWLAAALVRWSRAAFAAWTRGGYWTPWRRPQPAIDVPPPPPPAAGAA